MPSVCAQRTAMHVFKAGLILVGLCWQMCWGVCVCVCILTLLPPPSHRCHWAEPFSASGHGALEGVVLWPVGHGRLGQDLYQVGGNSGNA